MLASDHTCLLSPVHQPLLILLFKLSYLFLLNDMTWKKVIQPSWEFSMQNDQHSRSSAHLWAEVVTTTPRWAAPCWEQDHLPGAAATGRAVPFMCWDEHLSQLPARRSGLTDGALTQESGNISQRSTTTLNLSKALLLQIKTILLQHCSSSCASGLVYIPAAVNAIRKLFQLKSMHKHLF